MHLKQMVSNWRIAESLVLQSLKTDFKRQTLGTCIWNDEYHIHGSKPCAQKYIQWRPEIKRRGIVLVGHMPHGISQDNTCTCSNCQIFGNNTASGSTMTPSLSRYNTAGACWHHATKRKQEAYRPGVAKTGCLPSCLM